MHADALTASGSVGKLALRSGRGMKYLFAAGMPDAKKSKEFESE